MNVECYACKLINCSVGKRIVFGFNHDSSFLSAADFSLFSIVDD